MAVTVQRLLERPRLGLTVVGGERGLENPIRFPHISELADPTPWLSGGELLLTTGMSLADSPEAQGAYLERLDRAGLAGLGFGVGFRFRRTPAPLRAEADRRGFPLLEVPYPVPFIAITEAVATMLASERLREAQMSAEVHERLATLISEGMGPADVLDVVVELAGGWAVVFDPRGQRLARAASREVMPPDPRAVWEGLPAALRRGGGATTAADYGPHGTRVALAVPAGRRHEAVLVFGKEARLEQRDRIVVRHAVTVLGLLLASRRSVIDAERRIAGDILSDALGGRLSGPDLTRRLELAGFPSGSALTALVIEPGPGADLEEVAWDVDAILGARADASRTAVAGGRVAAVVTGEDPRSLAEAITGEMGADRDVAARVRVGIGNQVGPAGIRDSYLSALFALRAAPERTIASARDLGAFPLLLGAQPRPVLEGFVRSVLGPLLERDRDRSSELVASVRAYLAAAGRWEAGAHELGVHRHTLRYRMRQVETLLGRDLSSAEDRLELWLALKALDVLRE